MTSNCILDFENVPYPKASIFIHQTVSLLIIFRPVAVSLWSCKVKMKNEVEALLADVNKSFQFCFLFCCCWFFFNFPQSKGEGLCVYIRLHPFRIHHIHTVWRTLAMGPGLNDTSYLYCFKDISNGTQAECKALLPQHTQFTCHVKGALGFSSLTAFTFLCSGRIGYHRPREALLAIESSVKDWTLWFGNVRSFSLASHSCISKWR